MINMYLIDFIHWIFFQYLILKSYINLAIFYSFSCLVEEVEWVVKLQLILEL